MNFFINHPADAETNFQPRHIYHHTRHGVRSVWIQFLEIGVVMAFKLNQKNSYPLA